MFDYQRVNRRMLCQHVVGWLFQPPEKICSSLGIMKGNTCFKILRKHGVDNWHSHKFHQFYSYLQEAPLYGPSHKCVHPLHPPWFLRPAAPRHWRSPPDHLIHRPLHVVLAIAGTPATSANPIYRYIKISQLNKEHKIV